MAVAPKITIKVTHDEAALLRDGLRLWALDLNKKRDTNLNLKTNQRLKGSLYALANKIDTTIKGG